MKAVSEHLASITNSPPPGRRTTTSGRCRPSLAVDRGLFLEIERRCQARHLQDVAEHLLAPAPLHARAAAQRRRQLARLLLGRGEASSSCSICAFSPPVSSARAFSSPVTCAWNFSERLGHRLELRLQPGLGQPVLVAQGLLGALGQLVGRGLRLLGRLGAQDFRGLGLGQLDRPRARLGPGQLLRQPVRPRPLAPPLPDHEHEAGERQQERRDEGEGERVHAPFLAEVGARA